MSTAPDSSSAPFAYEIGGFRVGLDSPPFQESEHLAAFRKECRQDPELRLRVRVVPALLPPAGLELKPVGETVCPDAEGRRVRLCLNERKDAVLYRVTELGPGSLLAELSREAAPALGTTLLLRWLDLPGFFLARGAVFLHASFVQCGERAILFTGRKQIGKSTQAELWRRCRGARVINGDRALLRRLEGRWTACGSPYCGTSDICVNAKLPLGAVVLLDQSPENRAVPASGRETAAAFLSGCTFDPGKPGEAARILDLAEAVRRELPVLRLACRPDEGAVRCLEDALRKEGVHV